MAVVEAAAAARSLLGMEGEDRVAGAVVLVDAVGSWARQYSNRWLPCFPEARL